MTVDALPSGLFEFPDPPRRQQTNRLNDLSNREWIKFSKSFFHYEGDQALVDGMLGFFTKKLGSRSLIIGADGFRQFPVLRNITHIRREGLSVGLSSALHTTGVHDFILIDLRGLSMGDCLVGRAADGGFFSNIRQTLHDDCYCCLLVEEPPKGFPLAVAQASRSHLKLCEEKVCLVERTGKVVYCLILQACDDDRRPMAHGGMRTAPEPEPAHAPPWIIPKPPPRSRNELLHPAKFPEVLIEQLIDTFTEEGDNVLDPMAGTGQRGNRRHANGAERVRDRPVEGIRAVHNEEVRGTAGFGGPIQQIGVQSYQ